MRYMLFAFYDYYPKGGMNDFIRYFDTVELIYEYVKNDIGVSYSSRNIKGNYQYYQYYDTEHKTVHNIDILNLK